MRFELQCIAIVAFLQRVNAIPSRCTAQAKCELPSKNQTKLTYVEVYPYPTCGKGNDLISIVNESFNESVMEFMKNLKEQLVKKQCLPASNSDEYLHIKRDKCYAPVICNQKDQAHARWVQMRPFPSCNGKTNQHLHQLFDEAKVNAIKEIEKLLRQNKHCTLKAEATIERLKKQNWTLSNEDQEDCFVPVYCQYDTGVGENLMRFYPEDCKSVFSVPQVESAFKSTLDQAKEDFTSDFDKECDASCKIRIPATLTPASTKDSSIENQREFCSNHNGILYNGTCVWEEKRPENMTLVEAYRKCNNVTPSKLPEFYNEEQYNQLMDFLRSKIPSGETSVQAWLGLTRNHWTGKAILSNGELVPYDVKVADAEEQWINATLMKTNAFLDARKSLSNKYNGMGALEPWYTFEDRVATLLCQTLPSLYEPKFKSKEDEVWCENIGGIAYNGSCLWAEDPPYEMTLSKASEVCNERTPSKLPEVYGGHEYIEIMEYMRTKMKTVSTIAWTAMTRNIATNQAMLSDGTLAPYTKPRSSGNIWQDATEDRTNVYLIAIGDTTKDDQGMGAITPTYNFRWEHKILICQKL